MRRSLNSVIARARERIRRWLLKKSAAVEGVEISPTLVADGPTLRVCYLVRTESVRVGTLTLADGDLTVLQAQVVDGDGVSATRLKTGWSIALDAHRTQYRVRVDCVWRDSATGVLFPDAFPRPLRSCSQPFALTRLIPGRERGTVSLIGLGSTQAGPGYLAATVSTPAPVLDDIISCGGVTFVTQRTAWLGVGEPQRLAITSSLQRAFEEVAEQFDIGPIGTIEVKWGEAREGLRSKSATVIVLDSSWFVAPVTTVEESAILRWQLCRIWWGTLTRVIGQDGGELLFALRLLCLAQLDRSTRHADARHHSTMLVLIGGFIREFSVADHAAWYERSIRCAARMDAWVASDSGAADALRTVAAEMFGNEVDSAWLKLRLRAAGFDGNTAD